MGTEVEGKVLAKLGDSISTDDITSAKYVISTVPSALARICLRDIDPNFFEKMKPGGFLVGGKNFGCGSSREWAPVALKAAGVKAVLADQIARIFYRNAINIGLPVLECSDINLQVSVGDEMEVDLTTGLIRNKTKGVELRGIPLPEFLIDLIEAGGLECKLKEK